MTIDARSKEHNANFFAVVYAVAFCIAGIVWLAWTDATSWETDTEQQNSPARISSAAPLCGQPSRVIQNLRQMITQGET